EIEKEFGTISTRTFRGGTRGALKIVYWSSVEKISSSVFQQKLEKDIDLGKNKEDFSPFDIFQHIQDKNKKVQQSANETELIVKDVSQILEKTEKQLLILSGNVSFIEFPKLLEKIESLVKAGISIKIISRVDLVSMSNIEKLLSLNFKYRKELIEVRHLEQPLRAFISDNKIFQIKELTKKTRNSEKQYYLSYIIKDKDWTNWMSRIFWKFYSNSIDSMKRIEELKKLK
ncbi:MAG: hypothetical protein ABIH72_02895, partial [archaeon]